MLPPLCSGGISYSRVQELAIEKQKEIGLDSKYLGLHSLRSGGASAAVNTGVPDRWFKRHGRWLSENAKDGYVKDILEFHKKLRLVTSIATELSYFLII